MSGRRWALPMVMTSLCAVVFLAVSWPRPLDRTTISIPIGGAERFLDTVPVLPLPSPSAAPEPAPVAVEAPPAPEPPPTTIVTRGSGRQLRVGFAGPAPSPATVADALRSSVPLYSAPNQAEPDDWLNNPTWEGLPVVFLVHQRLGDWLNVQVSMRPNQATAWIKASDVQLRQVTQHILIDLNARKLTAYDGQKVVLSASVAPGTDDSPTPTGDFFLDGIVPLADTSGPYGAYQLSVAAFSNVYYSFGAGNGQIAIHGTNDPALIGTPASHGCVRMTNEDITALAGIAPLGTPVRIVG